MNSAPAFRIILIEDEPPIRRFVRMALEEARYDVVEAETGARGMIEIKTRRPDLVIVDLGLPDMDGIDLIRELRSWSNLPVLILSARTQEAEKVAALDAGADDYLTKPFGVPELFARVRALLRRASHPQPDTSAVVHIGEVAVCLKQRQVTRNGTDVHLTALEFRLLEILIANAGRVLTHHALLRDVWGPSHTDNLYSLRMYMSNLRRKLEHDPTSPKHFVTVASIGYRLVLTE
ncbi:MAG: response regulator [Magnetococcales bacterium]|nr:response regulator [Magnetococcales bacterium]